MPNQFKAGDIVRWAKGQPPVDKSYWLDEFGHGPFTILSCNSVYVTIAEADNNFFVHRFELDPFLTAVRRRRHGTT